MADETNEPDPDLTGDDAAGEAGGDATGPEGQAPDPDAQAPDPPADAGGDAGQIDEETAKILADLEAQLSSGDGDDAPEPSVAEVQAAVDDVQATVDEVAGTGDLSAMSLPDLDDDASDGAAGSSKIALLNDVALDVQIELGRSSMFVEDVLRLTPESVIELDKAAGDPVDIYVNERHVARGEVLVLNENFCVRISEIIQHDEDDDE